MKAIQRKLIYYVAFSIFFIFMIAFLIESKKVDPNTPTGKLRITISDTRKEKTILSVLDMKNDSVELKKGGVYRIDLEQDSDLFEKTVIYMHSNERICVSGSDKKGKIINISLRDSESFFLKADSDTVVSFSVVTYNKEYMRNIIYISNSYFLENLPSSCKNPLSIVLMNNIYKDSDLYINRPCDFYVNSYNINIEGNLIVDFITEGLFNMFLNNKKQIHIDEFYVNAPLGDVNINNIFFSAGYNFCIRSKSFNGNEIGNTVNIENPEQFIKLVNNDFYPKIYKDTVINLNNLKLTNESYKGILLKLYGRDYTYKDIVIDKPVTFNISGKIDINGVYVNIVTEEEGDIRVRVLENGFFSPDMINIDAPYSSLIWIGNPPAESYVAKLMNVSKYQGIYLTQYNTGGIGKSKLTGFTTDTTYDLEWNIRGNSVMTIITYDINNSDLSKVLCELKSQDGNAVFEDKYINQDNTVDLMNNPVIDVIDKDGHVRKYTVSVNREVLDLPVIHINTQNKKNIISKDVYVNASFSLVADHINSDYTIENAEIGIRGRGNSTWRLFEKKPYRIKFTEQTSVMGLKENKDWILLANYSDPSLIRNYVASEMGKKLTKLKFTPSSYPVDVFVNGEYQGVYTIGEQVEVSKSRVNIDEDYTNPDTGYLLEVGGTDNVLVLGKDFFHSSLLKWVAIKSPDTDKMSNEHFNFISDYVKKTDQAITNKSGYEEYIDIDSVIDWTILHEFTCNLDSGFRRSCFLYKENGGKLYMGPTWDFDLSFGNYTKDYSYDSWFTCEGETLGTTWTSYLYQDPEFNKKYKDRWNEVKKELKETALSAVEGGKNSIYASQKYNFKKWNKLLGNKTTLQPEHMREFKTFDEHIEYLTYFINHRYEWLDHAINELP